jgi:hypothetical protein
VSLDVSQSYRPLAGIPLLFKLYLRTLSLARIFIVYCGYSDANLGKNSKEAVAACSRYCCPLKDLGDA